MESVTDMDTKCFISCEDLANYMFEKSYEGAYIVSALFYEDAIELMQELLYFESVQATQIEIHFEEVKGYGKEFYVSLCPDGSLCVEPACPFGRYLDPEADIFLVDHNANKEIISSTDSYKCKEIYVGECKCCAYCEKECALNDPFEECTLIKDENGDVVGITSDVDILDLFYKSL